MRRKLPADFMAFMWWEGSSYKSQWQATKVLPRKKKKRFRHIISFCLESDGHKLTKKRIKYYNQKETLFFSQPQKSNRWQI